MLIEIRTILIISVIGTVMIILLIGTILGIFAFGTVLVIVVFRTILIMCSNYNNINNLSIKDNIYHFRNWGSIWVIVIRTILMILVIRTL